MEEGLSQLIICIFLSSLPLLLLPLFTPLSSPPPSTLLLSLSPFLPFSHYAFFLFPFLPFSLPALQSLLILSLSSLSLLSSFFFTPFLPPYLFFCPSPFPISLFHFFLELSRYQKSKASYIAHLPLWLSGQVTVIWKCWIFWILSMYRYYQHTWHSSEYSCLWVMMMILSHNRLVVRRIKWSSTYELHSTVCHIICVWKW